MSSVSLEQGAVCVAQSSGLFNIVHKHWSRVYFETQPFCHNFLCAGDCQTFMHIRINCRSGCDVELELVGSGDSILVLTVSQVLLLTTDLRSVVQGILITTSLPLISPQRQIGNLPSQAH